MPFIEYFVQCFLQLHMFVPSTFHSFLVFLRCCCLLVVVYIISLVYKWQTKKVAKYTHCTARTLFIKQLSWVFVKQTFYSIYCRRTVCVICIRLNFFGNTSPTACMSELSIFRNVCLMFMFYFADTFCFIRPHSGVSKLLFYVGNYLCI